MKRWLKVFFLVGLFFAVASTASAQGGFIQGIAWKYTPAGAFPYGAATVTICTSSAMGQPCTPTISLFSNAALSTPVANPLPQCTTSPQVGCIDNLGNFSVYATVGQYSYTITGPGLASFGPSPIAAISASASSSVPCVTTPNALQFNNISGLFGCASGVTVPDVNTLSIKGPGPVADVTAWGARAFNGSGPPQGTWASCSSSTTVALNTTDGGFTFINGDGIEIDFCGPTPTMGTPSAPTVTPATAAGPTGTGVYAPIPAAVVGSSTYKYSIVAKDMFGGVSAASTPTTITTGQGTLGATSAVISTITRANDVLTVTTAANNLVNQGISTNSPTMVHIIAGTQQDQMNGFYAVCVLTNSTTFTLCATPIDTRAQGWTAADTYNQTAGSVAYFVSNHIKITPLAGTWEYYICAERPGDANYHLIGVTRPQGVFNGYQDIDFDDFGSPFMDKQTYPRYMLTSGDVQDSKNAICTSALARPRMYSGTVTGGGGTTSLTVTPATSQTNAGPVFTTVDAEPGFLAAIQQSDFATSTNGMFGPALIPGGSTGTLLSGRNFSLYYPLVVPLNTNIQEEGFVQTYESIHLQGNTTWSGFLSSQCGTPQFGWNSYACVYGVIGDPIFYVSGQGNLLDHVGLNTNQLNAGIGVVTDTATGFGANYVNFANNIPSTDYLSMGLVLRDTTATISYANLYQTVFLGGPNQVTDASWTPLLWLPPGENNSGVCQLEEILLKSNRMTMNRRGIAATNDQCSAGPYFLDFDYIYRQGGIMPLFTFQAESTVASHRIFNTTQDTEASPLITCLSGTSLCGTFDLGMNSLTNNTPLYSGVRPIGMRVYEMGTNSAGADGDLFGIGNRSNCVHTNGTSVWPPFDTSGSYLSNNLDLFTCFTPMHIPGGQSFYFDIAQPTSLTATAAAGGSVPAATYYYCISPIGLDLGEGICSGQSNSVTTVLSGNQTVNLAWTGSLGAQSYNIYRCSSGATCLNDGVVRPSGGWTRAALHQTGTTYSDTSATTVNTAPPSVTGTGVSGSNNKEIWAPLVMSWGVSDGQTHTVVTTGASASLADGFSKTIAMNQEGTAGAAVTYTLPTAAAGLLKCAQNSNNGAAPDTGVLTIQTSAAGQFIIFTDGTLTASGGFVSSGGAAADNACVQGVDATHWQLIVQSGTWAKH